VGRSESIGLRRVFVEVHHRRYHRVAEVPLGGAGGGEGSVLWGRQGGCVVSASYCQRCT
jgi:hypothetical protein